MSVQVFRNDSILEALHKVPPGPLGPRPRASPPYGAANRSTSRRNRVEALDDRTSCSLATRPSANRDPRSAGRALKRNPTTVIEPELTAFEAFGPDDLYVDDTETSAR